MRGQSEQKFREGYPATTYFLGLHDFQDRALLIIEELACAAEIGYVWN